MNKHQSGFTLIELISVIVILGILAATAIPKFVDINRDARMAKVNAALGSLKSMSAMAHAKYLVNPVSPQNFEEVKVEFTNGYLDADSIAAAAGITSSDYEVTITGTTSTVSVSKTLLKCSATYTEPASTGGSVPTFTTDYTDC